ncbi:MAG: alpha/beta hydrolase [Candidatus Accumulibacter sp.]|jgi:pimeloyl-ACP methyl ester carboxylesterase|nr:alpha/beta hydrolase [Accumulibacter sp.]
MFTLLNFLLLVLAGFIAFTLCSNVLYWYETLNNPDERIPSPRPGIFSCLRQFAVTFAGYALCVGLFPFGAVLRRKPAPAGKSGNPGLPPVILLHGLNNNAAVWLYLARVLTKAGYSVSTCSYSSLFVPLDRIMRKLDEHVRTVESFAGGRKPVLICHSLGGIFARNWLREPGNGERASGVITLGTPHGGSKLASLAPGALAKNITPGAALIAALREAPPLTGVACVSLVSPTDEAVLPASGLVPPDGWKLRLTHEIGHFSMLFSPSVAGMVLEELRTM